MERTAEWKGFEPFSYFFDLEKVFALPLTERPQPEDGGADVPVTIDIVYQKLADKKLTAESLSGGVGVGTEIETTDGMKLSLKGPDFNRRVLLTMLRFRADGINPFEVLLFYYDKDSCTHDLDDCYSFFVVHKGKIIQERLSFFDHPNSGFDPSLFSKPDNSDPIWSGEGDWDEAEARFWYRKFYSETRTGQLMTLRPDSPKLFFHEDRAAPDIMGAIGVIARSLNSVRLLLWILVVVTILGFILRWR